MGVINRPRANGVDPDTSLFPGVEVLLGPDDHAFLAKTVAGFSIDFVLFAEFVGIVKRGNRNQLLNLLHVVGPAGSSDGRPC